MGEYEVDTYIKEIIAKYGRADVKQITADLGRYYYCNFANRRVQGHCQSMTRYGELRQTVERDRKGCIYRYLYEVVED